MSNLPPSLEKKIRGLGSLLRVYVAVDGAVTLVLAYLLVLGLDFAIDRFFEPTKWIRGFLLLGMIGLAAYIFYWRIGRRAFAVIRDAQLALVLERFVPSLNESLLTVVEFDESRREEVDLLFLQRTVDHAEKSLRGVDVRKFFRYGRLAFRSVLMLLIVGATVGLCSTFEETAKLWFSRNILLSSKEWPRRSQIVVDGFADGRVRIGRGDSFTLTVRASTVMPLVPDSVRLRVGSGKSGYRTLLLDQFRVDTVDGVDWRTFSYTFSEMLETLPFAVFAADSTLDDLFIEVVPPPTLAEVKIWQRFPGYIKREERTVSPSGRVTIPDGTSITIRATASKPLVSVRVIGQEPGPVAPELTSPNSFSFSLENLRQDSSVEFVLEDADGLRNRLPIRFDFGIVKDTPPVVTARLDGIGNAVTPIAALPTLGEVSDDYGLEKVFFRYFVERPKKEVAVAVPADSEAAPSEAKSEDVPVEDRQGTVEIAVGGEFQTLFPLKSEFSVSDRNLQPGDKLAVQVDAMDRFDLNGSKGQMGTGPNWPLEIVTSERLKGLLEVREISLRQRFEVLIGEVEKTKSILEEYSLAPPKELVDEVNAMIVVDEKLTDDERKLREVEREKKKKERLEILGKEQAESGMYAVSRMLRDTQKEVYEQRTIVEAFQSIRKEMVNNRIFSEEIRHRIDAGIIEPMEELIGVEFPDADRFLGLLTKALEVRDIPSRSEALTCHQSVLSQFDRILEKMRTVRDSMVSMESFNEAIELLRSILKQQQQIRNETQEEKNRQLKKLLE